MTLAPYCVSPADDLERAWALLNRHAIRHLPVLDGHEVVGVVLRRDLVVLDSIPSVHLKSIAARHIMKPVLSVSPNMPLDEAWELMIEHDVDCVVVHADAAVVGIFTAVDALRAMRERARRDAMSAAVADLSPSQ